MYHCKFFRSGTLRPPPVSCRTQVPNGLKFIKRNWARKIWERTRGRIVVLVFPFVILFFLLGQMYSHMLSLSTKTSKALEKQHYGVLHREQLGKKALWCYFYLSCEASWQITCNTTVVVLCCILRSCKTSSLVLTTSVVYIIHFQIHIWIVNTASCGAIKESFTILCTFLEMEFPRVFLFYFGIF